MTSQPKIAPIEDGPLMVTDVPNLRDGAGETIKAVAGYPQRNRSAMARIMMQAGRMDRLERPLG